MICNYPNCRNEQLFTPVVEIPTVQEIEDGTFRAADKPTYLIGHEVCETHRNNYNLMDWIRPQEWALLREAAHSKGFNIPEQALAVIKFMPLGWTPERGYIEVDR